MSNSRSSSSPAIARAQRLAQALRANLRKRKAAPDVWANEHNMEAFSLLHAEEGSADQKEAKPSGEDPLK